MNVFTPFKKSSNRFRRYNLLWPVSVDPLSMEIDMIRKGGRWTKPNGEIAGEGLAYHYRKFQEIAWPFKLWEKGPFKNHWAEKCLDVYLSSTYIGAMGCAGCVRGDTKIYNPETGKSPTISSLCESNTPPVVMTLFGAAPARVPFIKGTAAIYQVMTTSGRSFFATADHLVLSTGGEFSRVGDLRSGHSILLCEPDLPASTRGSRGVVASVKFVGVEKYYDLVVPDYHHYYAEGFIHHNSGKSDSFGSNVLTDWYCHSWCTTVLVSSTDLKSLELRIWGMIKKYHKLAKADRDWLPGHLIEGRQMLTLDPKSECSDGRDFKNGIIAVACFPSGTYVDTPCGPKKIEELRVGDDVANAKGRGKITSIHSRISKSLVRVKLSNGTHIDCTEEHPFFTSRGWVSAIDLETFDRVFSDCETLQIMRGEYVGPLSKQEILLYQLLQSPASEAVRHVRRGVFTTSIHRLKLLREILLSELLKPVGRKESTSDSEGIEAVRVLRSGDESSSLQPRFLLSEMPFADHDSTMQAMRESLFIQERKPLKAAREFLQQGVHGKGGDALEWQESRKANPGRADYLEVIPGIHIPISLKDWLSDSIGKEAVVSIGPWISQHKTGCGDRWRDTPDSRKGGQRCNQEQDIGINWVDRVEILQSSGDARFRISQGGYTVHNIEVDGHPSYSVGGVIVHNCKRGNQFVGLGPLIGIHNKRVRLLADECFVAGTMVDTPNGRRAIETIRPGDVVISAAGPNKVVSTFHKTTDQLYRIKTRDGREVICTGNHPFLTQKGWVNACGINRSHYMLSTYEAMSIMRIEVHSIREFPNVREVPCSSQELHLVQSALQAAKVKQQGKVLQPVVRFAVDAEAAGVSSQTLHAGTSGQDRKVQGYHVPEPSRIKAAVQREDEIAKQPRKDEGVIGEGQCEPSHAKTGESAEAFQYHEARGLVLAGAIHVGYGTNRAGENSSGSVSGFDLEFSGHTAARGSKIFSIQNRCSIPEFETGNRSGWFVSLPTKRQVAGCGEDRIPEGAWVDSCQVLEQADFERYRTSSDGVEVYTLQVSGHSSYGVVGLVSRNCNLMPRAFLDAASNLSKCEDFKLIGLGNPNETTNAHGVLCEPAVELGGWEGGVDQQPGTKTWKTRFPNGICIQLPGSDSPNMQAAEGEPPPFPFLITREQMRDDAQIWGVDDWHFTMMNEAKMPRGQGARRVLTRQTCLKFGAFGEPNWRDTRRTKIAFLDAAYRGVGGDRCVFGEMQFGLECEEPSGDIEFTNIIRQNGDATKGRQIIALIDLVTIPITSEQGADSAEDQIVKFVSEQCEARGIPPENFFYDAGMRTSLVTSFARLWQIGNSIDFGGKPSEANVSTEIQKSCRDYYSKFVTELWFSVRMSVESAQFRGITEEAVTEFSQREWKMVSGNRIEIESKAEMKLKCGRSPDLADAIAVGLFGARQRGFQITKLSTLAPKLKRGPDWRDDLKKKARSLATAGLLNHAI